jgi:hypothetical protein
MSLHSRTTRPPRIPRAHPRGHGIRNGLVAVAVAALAILGGLAQPASPAHADTASPIHAVGAGKCLDVSGNVATPGTGIDIWDCNNQANQKWTSTTGGQLQVFDSATCLDTVGGKTTAGTYLNIEPCSGAATQKWTINDNGTITSQASGLCMDVDHAGTDNGSKVLLWYCNGQTNQQWSRTVVTVNSTLTVDASTALHPVDRVGNGFLYGLADAATPSASIVAPLKPLQFRQPPPGSQHIPNAETHPVGEAMSVAPTVQAVGAQQIIDMADSFTGFPYNWSSWDDWYSRIDSMTAVAAASGYASTISSWEPWNEPDWTWPAAAGVSFNDGWARSVQRLKADVPDAITLGPSISYWNPTYIRSFLTAAKASGTLPDIICWHELSGSAGIVDHVNAYRAMEKELGISPRPISIDEYATTSEIDVPASANKYIAQFERAGVHDAERAFWYEAGTLNGLLFNGQPTASYWMYKWYADQTGDIVKVTPGANYSIDGVASYDAGSRNLSVVFGGTPGTDTVEVTGLSEYGTSAKVTVTSVPSSGRKTNVAAPTTLSTDVVPVVDGKVSITVPDAQAGAAYKLDVAPADLTAPVVAMTCPTDAVILGASATATWTATDEAHGSGLSTAASGSISLDTSSVGSKTATAPAATAVDNAGNASAAVSCNYSVDYAWSGFVAPVNTGDVVNTVKAGSAVPVKFSLAGDQGMAILAAGSPTVSFGACSSDPTDAIEQTVTAGSSGLQYDQTTDQYTYVWKTDKSWAGQCATLSVQLADGTTHTAQFSFLK